MTLSCADDIHKALTVGEVAERSGVAVSASTSMKKKA